MPPSPDGDPPFVDEHRVVVAADPPAVWQALADRLTRSGSTRRRLARLLGATPDGPGLDAGPPLRTGATMPGFAVSDAVPGQRLRLTGRHHFSRYSLTFELATGPAAEAAAGPAGTVLAARTHAAFPGLHGRAYRGLVIGSGAHRVVVGRMLRDVRRRAEDSTATGRETSE